MGKPNYQEFQLMSPTEVQPIVSHKPADTDMKEPLDVSRLTTNIQDFPARIPDIMEHREDRHTVLSASSPDC